MQNNNSLYTSSITITDNNSVKNGIESLIKLPIMGEENLMQQEKAVVSNDGENTTTSIIAKALNKNNFSSFTKNNKPLKKYKYDESYNLLKVQYLCSLSETEFISKFWDADELDQSGEKWDMDKYIRAAREGLEDILKQARKKGITGDFITITKKYKRTKKGRHFVQEFGLQKCQNKLRKFLSGDTSYDIDMVKCHWNIIVKLCEFNDITCNRIKKFLKNPNEIMTVQGVDKHDLLKMLYIDNYKSDNEFMTKLHKTKSAVFDEIMDTKHFKSMKFKPSDKSKKNKNTTSSVMSQYLQHLESEILISVLNEFGDDIEVLMFDGFQPRKSVDVKKLLVDLKKLTGFDWVQKDNTYEIDDWKEEELSDYLTWVKEFENNVFAVNEPKRGYAVNYDICKFLLSPHELLDRYPEHLRNVKDWIADESKRVYDRFVYHPYSAMSKDPTPSNEYNTWKPYERKVINKYISEDEISWFNKLLEQSIVNYKNLEEPDDECRKGAEWIKKWIARFIQYPDQNMGVYPVLFGQQGGGKDTLVNIIANLIGEERVLRTSNIEDVIGEGFNDCLYGKQFILLNENTSMDVLKVDGHIKNHVTADMLVIREKYQPTRTIENYTNIMFATNNPYPFAQGCRRSIGFQTKNWRGKDKSKSPMFFSEIYKQMEDETAMNKLWTYLNQKDVSNWKARNNLYDTHLTNEIKYNNTPDWIKYCWYLVDNKHLFTNEEDECITWLGVKAFKHTFADWKYDEKGNREFDYNVTKKQIKTTDCWYEKRTNKGMKITIDIPKLYSYLQINNPRE